MSRFQNPLANVSVAAPCPAEWDNMSGGDRVRFCHQCSLNVYNLSAMSRAEAETLVSRTEGRLCIRFYRRRDGSIITRDCPVGLLSLKRRAMKIKKAIISAALGFLAGVGANATVKQIAGYRLDSIASWNQPLQGAMIAPPRPPETEMGKMAVRKPDPAKPRGR